MNRSILFYQCWMTTQSQSNEFYNSTRVREDNNGSSPEIIWFSVLDHLINVNFTQFSETGANTIYLGTPIFKNVSEQCHV